MTGTVEEALTAAIEPVVDMVVALQKSLDTLARIPGEAGAGIEAPAYVPGDVYREGSIVTANLGQYFKALKDTASAPDVSDHWGRVGTAGFRFTGPHDAAKTYAEGDLYIQDFGLFGFIDGAPRLLVGRGAKGERGAVGPSGRDGRNGKDGGRIIAIKQNGQKAVLVQEFGGESEEITLDFSAAFSVNQRLAQNLETVLRELEVLRKRLAVLEKTARQHDGARV